MSQETRRIKDAIFIELHLDITLFIFIFMKQGHHFWLILYNNRNCA